MDIRYWLWRGRVIIAACCIAVAVIGIVDLAAPRYRKVEVARLSHDMACGDTLGTTDVEVVKIPWQGVPDRTLTVNQAAGRKLVAALPAGTVLSPGLLAGKDQLAADSERVLVTVPLSELSSPSLEPGSILSLYAPGPTPEEPQAQLLATDVRLLALHRLDESQLSDKVLADVAVSPEVASVVLAHAATTQLLAASGQMVLPSQPPTTVKETSGG